MQQSQLRARGLLDPLRERLRSEKTYIYWARNFICFHGKRHPREMGAAEVERNLTQRA